MTELKQSDFEPILDKTFAEIFKQDGGCQQCGKGFVWQNPARDLPDCSNVFCNWNRKKRNAWR